TVVVFVFLFLPVPVVVVTLTGLKRTYPLGLLFFAAACTRERSWYRFVVATGWPVVVTDGGTSAGSRSYSSSSAVLPMIDAACSGLWMPASWMTIWSVPCFLIFGDDTPSLAPRLPMIDTERS